MSNPTLEKRIRGIADDLDTLADNADYGGVFADTIIEVANPDTLREVADEVKALEAQIILITSMTIEAAGAGLVESQEARIEKLEAALIGFRVRPGARTLPEGHFLSCPLGRYPKGGCGGRCAKARAALHREDADA